MSDPTIAVTIYHNPACGTSRNTLGLIRNAGIEPTVIEYLKTPPGSGDPRVADPAHGDPASRSAAPEGHAL